jgi:hypothetical protein
LEVDFGIAYVLFSIKYLIGHGLNVYINTPTNADVIEHEIQWKLQTIKWRRLERHQHD